MDLRELIQAGSAKAGEQKALAALLHVGQTDIANAKAGRRGLPAPACFLLAQYLEMDPARVIAASELVTEKNEERRKVFYPFVMGRAAMLFAASALLGTIALPTESQAAPRSMTPATGIIVIMSNCKMLMLRVLSALREMFPLQQYAVAKV